MNEARDAEKAFETKEWLESLEEVKQRAGAERVVELLHALSVHAHKAGIQSPFSANTPYVNSIALPDEPAYPGDVELERRIGALIRWNAMAMVVRANREEDGIGGHIASYASSATMLEVGFNHFFRAPTTDHPGDLVYFQGHASPGIYARAFLEGRLSDLDLSNFRRELQDKPGLSSYPHPWLMPDFWQFPTVSMGLGPINAIYHARFIKYLEDRGLKAPSDQKIWVFMGDGESDEPESLGAITLAARERLDNLIFVINCNLQRLDGPVRGNGKIIQELEAAFRGAGWHALKVIWGQDWDPLLANDTTGGLVKRLTDVVDGQFQKYVVAGGAYMRKDLFGSDKRLLDLVKNIPDDKLHKLRRGGHDRAKVYAAFKAATEHTGQPTVILCQTIKGYGMGAAGEALNITHQQKKLNNEALLAFRDRFNIPLSDEQVEELPFYRPAPDSPEAQYLQRQRSKLGGYVPQRSPKAPPLPVPADNVFDEFIKGTGDRAVSTTMAFVRILSRLLDEPGLGERIVPMVPDEARTFGMDALFRKIGIYSHPGQLYEPVDSENLLYYREASDGQILEEGITEAGCMGSFVAAGTAYANHGVSMLPFWTFYSMFGLQRVGDFVWAAADSRARGFMMGATAGRTTLAGEGLQHQDGNSLLLAMTVPNLLAYDPAYAYELAVIIQDGIKRMYHDDESVFYYITLMNENYPQPAMPDGAREGILKGLYCLEQDIGEPDIHLVGGGTILGEVRQAAETIRTRYGIKVKVWSATSYGQLYREANEAERWNRLHPDATPRVPHVAACIGDGKPVIIGSDYVQALANSVAPWIPGPLTTLGTDGFGRSEGRSDLRRFFEVNATHVAYAAAAALVKTGALDAKKAIELQQESGIDPESPNPATL